MLDDGLQKVIFTDEPVIQIQCKEQRIKPPNELLASTPQKGRKPFKFVAGWRRRDIVDQLRIVSRGAQLCQHLIGFRSRIEIYHDLRLRFGPGAELQAAKGRERKVAWLTDTLMPVSAAISGAASA
jgi:hypothetical protein